MHVYIYIYICVYVLINGDNDWNKKFPTSINKFYENLYSLTFTWIQISKSRCHHGHNINFYKFIYASYDEKDISSEMRFHVSLKSIKRR